MSDPMTTQLRAHLDAADRMSELLPDVHAAGQMLCQAFAAGGTLYTFGNGGSAADAQHFTGELIGHYARDRRPLRAVTLSTDTTTMTCIANDYDYADVFSRQVRALARPGDVVAAFTTSGVSANIVDALAVARANGATTILFGGRDGGPARAFADYALIAPATATPRIQEMHTMMLHMISEMADDWAAATDDASVGGTTPAPDATRSTEALPA